MLRYVQQCPQRFDVVTASYAVHHLSAEGKARLVGALARLLNPGGCFLLVDVFLREGACRPRGLGMGRAAWRAGDGAGAARAGGLAAWRGWRWRWG